MSLLGFFLSADETEAQNRDPTDEYWYNPVGYPVLSGVQVNDDSAMNLATCWACTRILSATAACLPFHIHRRIGKTSEIAAYHPTDDLIAKSPNEEMGSVMFRSSRMAQQINNGNCYAEIERLPGTNQPRALWPIHYSRVTPRRDDATNRLFWEINNEDLTKTNIWDADMLHIPSMMSADGIIGKGVIRAARETIGFGLAVEREGASRFGNMARPDVVIKGGKFKNDDAREYYRNTWQERFGGVTRAGKPAMLPDGADLELLSFNADDQQYIETRQGNVEELCRWYGVPPHMVQHLLRMTDNNIEWQGMSFVVYSLMPWIKLWEETVERKLLTPQERRAGLYAKHNVNALLRGDTKARAEFYTAMRNAGVFSVNDILELEDRNPIGPEGDKRLAPINHTTLQQIGEDPPKQQTQQPAQQNADVLKLIAERLSLPAELINGAQQTARLATSQLAAVADSLAQQEPQPTTTVETLTVEPTPNNTEVLAATWAVVEDVYGLMIRTEADAARRASKHPEDFLSRIDKLYEAHAERLLAALDKPVAAWFAANPQATLTAEESVITMIRAHIETSKAELMEAAECQSDQLEHRVSQCVRGWPSRRPNLPTEPSDA